MNCCPIYLGEKAAYEAIRRPAQENLGQVVLVPHERRTRVKKRNIGSSFDRWLREEGIYEEVTATAIKRVLARQVEAAMKGKNLQPRGRSKGCSILNTMLLR